jgi:hypothetical protein
MLKSAGRRFVQRAAATDPFPKWQGSSVSAGVQHLTSVAPKGGENDPLEVALTKDSKSWSAGKRGCNSDFNSPLTPGDWNRLTYGIQVCIKESWCAVSRVA